MTTYISIIVAILAFSVIVVVHELGHLLAAKKAGIFVEEFAVGMGPKIIGRKFGETIYSIRALPIGGFCKMMGEDAECDDPRAFGSKKPLPKFIVIVAGAVFNFIFGIILIFIMVLASGYTTTVVNNASPDLPAYQAGIREGDKIVSVDGRKTHVFEDILFAMYFANGKEVKVETISGGEKKVHSITPAVDEASGRKIIGVNPKQYSGLMAGESEYFEKATFAGSVTNTFDQFKYYVGTTYDALYMLITSVISLSDLSGIVGIGNAFVQSIETPMNTTEIEGEEIPLSLRLEAAFLNVMNITILITINLGIMNLLPFPALDGGRAIFIMIEGIRRKPIDPNTEGLVHFAGFVLLMLLMVFVTYNDILKLF